MAKIMTPSASATEMTRVQLDKAVNLFRTTLEKHAGGFSSEPVQQVLGNPNFVGEIFENFRRRVEALSSLVMRRAEVNRTRTPKQVLEATGRKQYNTDPNVVKTMPKGEGDEVAVYFFKPRPEVYDKNGLISDDNLEKEFEFVGLKPADPYTLAQVNTEDPAFADERPNGTHWKNAEGKWCFAAFNRWDGGRSVRVDVSGRGWVGDWWFAGVRKSSHFSPAYAGEFCFMGWWYHPPSILPISSKRMDKSIYFLSIIPAMPTILFFFLPIKKLWVNLYDISYIFSVRS